MTDREKLVKLLEDVTQLNALKGTIEETADYLIAHGVTVKEKQRPLHRRQLVDSGFFFLERKEEEEVYPVVLKERWEVYFVDFVGTNSLVRHNKVDYGKTWRCWAEKPTEEERRAAEWKN